MGSTSEKTLPDRVAVSASERTNCVSDKPLTYRPMPHGVDIAPSEIDGMGIFAYKSLPAHLVLGMARIWVPDLDEWIRTPLGGYCNHSDAPNCVMMVDEPLKNGSVPVHLVTNQLIRPMTELTVTYSLYYPE